MPLNIEQVHVLERDSSGRDTLVKSSPYTRFVSSDGGAISVQGGRFYSDGSNQPAVPFRDVPKWAWRAVRGMSPEGRLKVGLPENMDDIEELPEPEKDVGAETSDDAQSLSSKDEPGKTLVDYVYELDHSIDTHWTKAGLPDLNALKEAIGKYTTRGEVEAAAPGYRRKES